MGGNAWVQTGPYQQELGAAFRRAQEQELEKDDHGFGGQSLDELWENEDWHEYIFTGGTGTVLDLYQLIDAGTSDEFAMMRPLTEDQIRAWAPDGRPTYSQLTDALQSEQLAFPGRGCGRCTVLYRDGGPAEIGYWGVTAD
ncbi:hypothetical protein ACWD4L_12595 [Streptomyces sp. NPDC002596]